MASASNAEKTSVANEKSALAFQTDLVGVQSSLSEGLKKDDELLVSVRIQGEIRSAVCETSDGAVVGTLAAFRGLSNLIGSLEKGAAYVAVPLIERTLAEVSSFYE